MTDKKCVRCGREITSSRGEMYDLCDLCLVDCAN